MPSLISPRQRLTRGRWLYEDPLVPRKVYATGKSGSGKTYLMKQVIAPEPRVIAIDLAPDPRNPWADSCLAVETWQELADEIKKPRFRVAFSPIEPDPPVEIIDTCAQLALSVTNCVLVVDELHFFYPGGQRTPSDAMQYLFRLGRREGVAIVLISQRPVDCPIDLRSQFTDIVCFQTSEPRDIEWLSAVVGGRQEARKALALPRRQFLHWNIATGIGHTSDEEEDDNDDSEQGALGNAVRARGPQGGSGVHGDEELG